MLFPKLFCAAFAQCFSITASATTICFIGDSITSGGKGIPAPTIHMTNAVNFGLPEATSWVWRPGSLLGSMKLVCGYLGGNTVMIMLGVNDARARIGTSTEQYAANITAIADDLAYSGFRVILNYPPIILAGKSNGYYPETTPGQMMAYAASLEAIADGRRIFIGDRTALNYFAEHPEKFRPDMIHPNESGSEYLGVIWSALP